MAELLYLTHRIPYPPNKGDKIRSYHVLRHLSERYRVHLGTFIDDANDWQHLDAVKALCGETYFARRSPALCKLQSFRALLSARPLTLDYYRDRALQQWVNDLLKVRPVTHVLAFSSPMAQYLMKAQGLRRVIDFVDIDSDKWCQYAKVTRWPTNWIYRRECAKLFGYERKVAQEFAAALFVSKTESERFSQLVPDLAAKIGYFNNGVDTDYFSPAGGFPNPYPGNACALVFTGAMDYFPNVDAVAWFAKHVFPAVRAQAPDTVFYIVGAKPNGAVRALSHLPGVCVTGGVPDVRPYLAHARVAVAPLRIARGIQNKVLEAMAMARPVLASPQALEGISAKEGEEVFVARTAQEFAKQALALLREPRPAIGSAARARILADCRWEDCLSRIDDFLEPLPQGQARASHEAARHLPVAASGGQA